MIDSESKLQIWKQSEDHSWQKKEGVEKKKSCSSKKRLEEPEKEKPHPSEVKKEEEAEKNFR